MKTRSRIGYVVAATVLFGACGGTTSDGGGSTSASSTSSSSTSSASSSGNTSSSSSSTGGTTSACPASVPTGTCSPVGLECEYGDDPRLACRTKATCETTGWSVVSPRCTALPPATCPASRAAAAGQACTPQDAVCDYAGVVCECTNCVKYPVERCEGPVVWKCEEEVKEPAGCPAGRPRLGTACTSEGLKCLYGCEDGASRECKGGAWASASSPGGCPRSSRAVKTDIHYLGDSERAALANEARSLPLATWRYTGRLDDGRVHVGYVLEDAPLSPSSNMARGEVDLYAYTTMSLALAQQQQREIEELRREIAALKRRQ